MSDLGTKIRRHYEETTPPIDIDALVDRLETKPAQPRPQLRRGLAVAFVAALLLLIAVAGPILLNNRSEVPVISPSLPAPTTVQPAPETTIPAVETTVPEAPAATLLDGSWVYAELDSGFVPWAVVESGLGFVATGSQDGIWFSGTGTEWQQVIEFPLGEIIEDASLLPGEQPRYTARTYVKSMVEYDGAVYVFATILEDPETPDMTRRPVTYRSTDGTNWSENSYAGDESSQDAVAGENELLKILGSSESRTPIIRSEDGMNWTRYNPGLDLETVAFVDGEYLAVAVGPPGSEEYPNGKRTMVRSVDGIEWDPIPGSDFPSNAFPSHLTQYDGRLYMGGIVFDDEGWQKGMVFHSDDGHTWQQAQMPDFPSVWYVTQLISSPHGLMALGSIEFSEDPAEVNRIVPLTTVDGTSFVEVPHPPGMFDDIPNANGYPTGYSSGYSTGEQIIVHAVRYPIDETGGAGGEPGTYHQWIWTPNN